MDVERFNEWIDQKIPKGFDCALCSERDWVFMGQIATRALDHGTVDPDAGFPLVSVTCANCGHVVSFSRQIIDGSYAG